MGGVDPFSYSFLPPNGAVSVDLRFMVDPDKPIHLTTSFEEEQHFTSSS